MYVEASKTTAEFAEDIGKMLKKEGRKLNIQTSMKKAKGAKSKIDSIFAAAPDIRDHFVFLASGHRTKEYEMFMQNVFSFKLIGKNKNDDAPDSLQMAANFALTDKSNKVTVVRRSFL